MGSQPSSALVETSKMTAEGLKSGEKAYNENFMLKKAGIKDGAEVSWSKRDSVGGSKIKVTKAGKLYAYKGLKKGVYKVRVTMSISPTANYKAKSISKTIEVVVK